MIVAWALIFLVGVVLLAVGLEVVIAFGRSKSSPGPWEVSTDGAPGEVRVVWLGDSTVVGQGAEDENGSLARQVMRQEGEYSITSFAWAGARVNDVIHGQLPKVEEVDPSRVYISAGSNDVTRLMPKKRFEAEYRTLLEALKGKQVTVFGIPEMGAAWRVPQPLRKVLGLKGRQLDKIVKLVCEEAGVTYIDVRGNTGDMFLQWGKRYLAKDGFHPNAEGYALWVDALLDSRIKA